MAVLLASSSCGGPSNAGQPTASDESKAIASRGINYTYSDAWLLHAILISSKWSGDDASLRDVLEAGDALNIAIFTLQEINGGLVRLEHGGLVTVAGKRMKPSPTATNLLARAVYHRSSSYDVTNALASALGAPGPAAPSTPSPTVTNGEFTDDEVRQALAEYSATVRALETSNNSTSQ